jgi:hypothetical protein
MLRRKLIAYPAACLVAVAGTTLSYNAARRFAADAARSAHFLAMSLHAHQPAGRRVVVVTTVRSAVPVARVAPVVVTPAAHRAPVVPRARCSAA